MSGDTVFDKILKGEIPSKKVFEDEEVLAFHDIHPVAPTHVLVIPKKKVATFDSLAELDEREVGRYFKKIALVADKLGLSERGYRVVFNCGAEGGQTVDYLHAHILGGRSLGGFE